jgi:H+-transporting ATPase
MTVVHPFHTDSDVEDPVYHDQAECPYGMEIRRNGRDLPGADDRRLCDWCMDHR